MSWLEAVFKSADYLTQVFSPGAAHSREGQRYREEGKTFKSSERQVRSVVFKRRNDKV